MNKTKSMWATGLAAAASCVTALSTGCVTTSHPVMAGAAPAATVVDLDALADTPGPLRVETLVSATWEVERSGLVNLNNAKAIEAGLKDGPAPISIRTHVIRHPTRGTFLIDSGVEEAFRNNPSHALVTGLVANAMHVERLVVQVPTRSLATEPIQAIFFTHLHLDHILGVRETSPSAALYVGPGEAQERGFQHLFTRGIVNDALAGHGPLQEWQFAREARARFAGAADVFGDGSFFALHVPGHTPGSTAYFARSTKGGVLFTGDACHTRWGWDNEVEPGTFSSDQPLSRKSLLTLRAFAKAHPAVRVEVGHE
jgi:N-acyl homoserine lactone hydrolase